MVERWESFHEGAAKLGALWRRLDGDLLTTRIAFPLGAGETYRAESVIVLEPDGGSWVSATYREGPGAVECAVTRTEAGLGADTMPSYGEYLLVRRLLASGAESARFWRIDDGDPAASPAPAVLVRAGTEVLALADGDRACLRVDVLVGGERVGSHWADAESVVRSDWVGAESYREPTAEAALAGLPPQVVAFLRHGFGG